MCLFMGWTLEQWEKCADYASQIGEPSLSREELIEAVMYEKVTALRRLRIVWTSRRIDQPLEITIAMVS